MPLSENQALLILSRELRGTYASGRNSLVSIGIGDDTALLRFKGEHTVWTIDACHEGTHFLWDWMLPEDVAHKSFHAALSDVPAMGARPLAALCQLTISSRVTAAWLGRFARTQAEVARATRTPIVGGNICFGDRVEVVTTVIGECPPAGPLRRDGARVGDEVWLVGEIGLARAGLLFLQRNGGRGRGRGAQGECLAAFRRPHALVSQGARLLGRAHSCMDISDGLARDAGLLAAASGVRLAVERTLFEGALPKALRLVGGALGTASHELALEGGEDYALLATGPGYRRPRFARVIGRIEKGRGAFFVENGRAVPLVGGYEHRRRA